jgi:hemolysin-activating ACP:hemolysin acyltransferase
MLKLQSDCVMFDSFRQRIVGAVSIMLLEDEMWSGDLRIFLLKEIIPSIQHGKFALFTNFDGVPVGFITWAHLGPETEARVISTLNPELHVSEWNEGSSLWVRSMHLPRGLRRRGIQLCLEQLFPHDAIFRFLFLRKKAMTAIELPREVTLRFASRLWA